MGKLVQFKIPAVPKEPNPIVIDKFYGIDKSASESKISLYCSPDELNNALDERLTIDKRPGYKRIYDTSLGVGKINGLFLYRKNDNTVEMLMCHTNKLYRVVEGSQPTLIYNGLNDHEIFAFQMGGYLYILDGANYKRYDGTNVIDVTSIAYVPTLTMGRGKDGGGSVFESFNLLTPYYIDSFSPDGSSTTYPLSQTNLDAAAITASIDGGVTWNKIETTDFTVNRTTGLVTFITAPPKGTDTLKIKPAKTISGNMDKIKKCTKGIVYGGENDTRVILKNGSIAYRSGLLDPTYFLDDAWQVVGNNNSNIQNFAIQYDYNVILKEDGIYIMEVTQDSTGAIRFKTKPVNYKDGCYSTNSLQFIKNAATFLNKNRGICAFTQTTIRTENNVIPVSEKINADLLKELDLDKAVSADYEGKYMLACPSGKVYVWYYDFADPYTQNNPYVWTEWNNIHASCFLEKDGYLYFGSSTEGLIYRFYKYSEARIYNDDETAINQYWTMKLYDYEESAKYKNIPKLDYTMKPKSRASCKLSYATEEEEMTEIQTDTMDLFDYTEVDYLRFSYITNRTPKPVVTKPKLKKIISTKFKLENNVLNEGMGINNMAITFNYGGDVK